MKQPMTSPCFSSLMRLIWIDAFLADGHDLNRSDLMQAFGISLPQAALDLSEFRRRWPWRARYDASRKCYRAGPHVRAIFPADLRLQVLSAASAVKRARARLPETCH